MKFNFIRHATVLAIAVAAMACSHPVQAGWGVLGGGSSGGSSGGYTAAYGSSGGASSGGYTAAYSSVGGSWGGASSGGASTGGSHGGPGLLHRVASRIHEHWAAKHARHAARRAAYGSSGGYASVGGHGSSGGYAAYSSYGGSSGGSAVSYSGGSSGGSVSYGSTGASYGSTGYSSGVSYGSTGYSYGSVGGVYHGAANASPDASNLVSDVVTEADAVYLTVAVPSEAKVFVNDDATSSTGSVRKFVSHGLEAGKQYRFVVRAELSGADGQPMTEEKTVVVTAGESEELQFAFSESARPVETAITLSLPQGAVVRLAGNETKATGAERTFRTTRLKVGEFWDDYEIEVHYQGQVKRQTVRLVGGDDLHLAFDFAQEVDNLAAR